LAGEPAHAAAEGQAADPGVRDVTGGGGEAVWLRRPVECAEQRAALDPDAPPDRVDPNGVQRGQVDHQAVRGDSEAGHVVPAAAHPDLQAEFAGQAHRGHHVGDARDPHDHPRAAVDHGVPHGAGRVVIRVARGEEAAVEARADRWRHKSEPDGNRYTR
jgi:hypothetical protein